MAKKSSGMRSRIFAYNSNIAYTPLQVLNYPSLLSLALQNPLQALSALAGPFFNLFTMWAKTGKTAVETAPALINN
jgi:hypothetical protein